MTKKAKVIKKESPQSSTYLTHYTVLYRGRTYVETLQGPYKDRYNVGDIVQVATYKDKRGNLCIVMHKVLPRG